MSEPVRRALPPSVFARLADATRYLITGVSPDTWFGPLQPLAPMAPPEVKGRQWDYPFGANLNYIPRAEDGVSFAELRGLADALPLLRAVIETRKDQIAAQSFAIRARNREDSPASSQAIDQVTRFFARPDRRRSFADWLGCCSRRCWSSTRRPSIRATIAAARSMRSTSSTGRRSSR